ncbi:mitochondrial inner membrane protein [Russula aff. rugulosa BPL654]|nr:mitochondrial inner membrane protein [Russula aff. rugulosa BPL654]
MASSVFLRSSLAVVAKRPLLPFQLARRSTNNFAYVPGGPIYKGTVNEPTTFPLANKSNGSHHWTFERLLAAGLVPLTGAAFVTSGSFTPLLDGLLGISLIVHSHIGFDCVLVDYLHKRKFPMLGPFAVGVGVYQFNTNDIGLTELIRRVWTA